MWDENKQQIDVQLYYKFRTEFRPYMIKMSQDFCALLNGSNPLFANMMGVEYSGKYGNFHDPCPLYVRHD